MLDYQRILDDVQVSLDSTSGETLDLLRSAAADYKMACEEVNERLRRCDSFLRRGLRSEAIQLAEIEPVLLDVVTMLDFPDRPQWNNLLAQHGIAAGPSLSLDLAAELNEAYAHERPLAGLLAQHRLLALARSPLRSRIQVLRQLAEQDAQNAIWREDLSTYEQERQRQLHKEVTAASEAGNLAVLMSLDEELRGDPWLEAPPAGLLSRAAEARTRLLRHSARQELEQLATALDEAHCQFDLPAGRQLRGRWNAAAAVARIKADDALARKVAPTLDWLAQQDRLEAAAAAQRQAVAQLESALLHGADRGQLEALYQAATLEGQELPAELEQQYRERLTAIDRRAARRRRLRMAARFLVTVGVSAAIAAFALHETESGRIAAAAAALAQLIDDGKLDEAQEFADRLAKSSPDWAADTRVASLVVRIEGLKNEDAQRHEAFEASLAAALAGGDEQPDQEAVARAHSLVRTPTEQTELMELDGRITAARTARQERRETDFRSSLAKLSSRVEALSANRALVSTERLPVIDTLRQDLAALQRDSTDLVDPDSRRELDALSAKVDADAKNARGQVDQQAQEAAITRAVGDVTAFHQAMQGYVDRFQQAPRTPAFTRTLAESALWSEVDDWNALVATWGSATAGATDPKRAGALAAAIKAFCGKHPEWPGNATLQARVPNLQAVARRVEDDQPLTAGLERLFRDPLMADVWLVELKDHKRYYTRTAPDATGTGLVHFKYVAGFDLSEKTRNIKSTEVHPARRAPQVALSEKALQILAGLNGENWDSSFRELIAEIWRSDAKGPKIDPLLKLKLLQQTVEVAARGSSALESELAQQIKMMQGSKVSPIANWLEPDDAEANTSREQAVRELDMLAKVPPSTNTAAEKAAQAKGPLGKAFQWVGWLRKGPDDRWQCAADQPLPQSGKLYVLAAAGEKEVLHAIGHLTAKGAQITATGPALVEGRPIYIVERPDGE
jgi:hypothetical protein